jgi:hypothetical protein
MMDWIVFLAVFGGLLVLVVIWLLVLLPRVLAANRHIEAIRAQTSGVEPEERGHDPIETFKEVSALNRDFEKDVGRRSLEHAVAITNTIRKMNPEIKREHKVEEELRRSEVDVR